jgi:DNA-binding transcriptional MerR regulator
MRYRVDEIAARAAVSVDTVRFYQSRGLLPLPEREGRLAWYGHEHLERLQRIKDLKDKGFTLASIRRLLTGDLDPSDAALVEALTLPASGTGELLTIDQLAERTGVSEALLQAIEREGLLSPVASDDGPRYSDEDAEVVAAGIRLLEAGLPLGELLSLARDHDDAMRQIAQRAVEMFLRFVRDPIRAGAASEDDAATSVVEAFRQMLPATTSLVAHHFRRLLLAEAQARIDKDDPEVAEGLRKT